MSKVSGGSAIAMTAVAGAVVVGAAWWYKNDRAPQLDAPAETAVALIPNSAPEAPEPAVDKSVTQEVAKPAENTDQASEASKAEPEAAEEIAEAAAEPETAPGPRPAAFDEVRREEDGMTIIAGRADPRARVEVLLDGKVITKTSADAQGKFAAITMIAPDGQGHVLSLMQTVGERQIASLDQIILAPMAAPVVVAQATTAPTPEEVETPQATQNEAQNEAQSAKTTLAEQPEGTETAQAGEIQTQTDKQELAEDNPIAAAPTQDSAEAETSTAAVEPSQSAQGTTAGAVTTADVAQAAPETQIAPTPVTPDTSVKTEPDSSSVTALVADAGPADSPQTSAAESAVQDAPAPETSSEAKTANVAVLKSTEDGVELLNVPRPEAMQSVALDTISYSESGEVQLAGRAQSDTRNVRVYLNNSSIVSLTVDEFGRWRGDLPDVDEGIYTLRVDEVATDGRVTSRVETPFKRESPVVLAEAAAKEEGPLKQITVQKGATLWAIARDRYGDGLLYVNVFQANAGAIRDPDLIYPGQVFELPD